MYFSADHQYVVLKQREQHHAAYTFSTYTATKDNRKSMPGHLADHANAGRYHWGIFIVSKHASYKRVADRLSLYWEASDAEEWVDRVEWLDV